MVSIAVVGPSMSGKTHLCLMLAGLNSTPASVHRETCGTNFLKVEVDNTPWHIWDTPAFEESGWAATDVANEANVIVICHDGRYDCDPCRYVRHFGTDRCIIALTRSQFAGMNLSWSIDYFRIAGTPTLQVVPVVQASSDVSRLICTIMSNVCARRADLVSAFEHV